MVWASWSLVNRGLSACLAWDSGARQPWGSGAWQAREAYEAWSLGAWKVWGPTSVLADVTGMD